MIRRREALLRRSLLGLDVAVTALAFVVTFELRQALAALAPSLPPLDAAHAWRPLLLALLPVWAVLLHAFRCHDFRVPWRVAAARYARVVVTGLALVAVGVFLLKLHFVARSFVVLFGVVDLVALLAGRRAVLGAIALLHRSGVDAHRVVVVGCGADAVAFGEALRAHQGWGVQLVGYVEVGGLAEPRAPGAVPLVGHVDRLDRVLDRQPVDEVAFVVPGRTSDAIEDALRCCAERGVDVSVTLPPVVSRGARVEVQTFDGYDLPLLTLRRAPADALRLAVKRIVDLAGAGVLLALTAPLLAATALAIRLDTRGPVLFRQERCGRNGRRFSMLKFRSMVCDAEARRPALEPRNEMNGPVFKIKDDPRVTRVGRVIRRFSVDELPQLLNVLRGDMSLIGPRPPLPSEVEAYAPWQRRRLSMKPGLTGLWQVSGRNRVDFEQWMELDLRYIDNWSLWLDFKILLRTVPAVLSGSGAS
jgi:exopolysaccharide biosynthesis polyprenyl glycosylphosphotransferase